MKKLVIKVIAKKFRKTLKMSVFEWKVIQLNVLEIENSVHIYMLNVSTKVDAYSCWYCGVMREKMKLAR